MVNPRRQYNSRTPVFAVLKHVDSFLQKTEWFSISQGRPRTSNVIESFYYNKDFVAKERQDGSDTTPRQEKHNLKNKLDEAIVRLFTVQVHNIFRMKWNQFNRNKRNKGLEDDERYDRLQKTLFT
jgi:hypothetical protein